MNLDRLIEEVRSAEPAAGEIEEAAARVASRLFPQARNLSIEAAAPAPGSSIIRDCAGFKSLIPAYLAGTLDADRGLLLQVHTRECVACRGAVEMARSGAREPIPFRPRPAAHNYAVWAIAASALLAAGGLAWWGMGRYPGTSTGARATVDSIEGGLYKVSGATLTPLAPGAELAENETVRTARSSTAVLRLGDGSRIELGQRAALFVTKGPAGSIVHLALGSIIVRAAKQRAGTLQVVTADCNVSVKGTVFAVDAGTKGSRVAVAEGTVWVDHGAKHDVLHRGDETSTASAMSAVPIRQEFEWSRDSGEYLALVDAMGALRRDIAAIPAEPLRYESRLMGMAARRYRRARGHPQSGRHAGSGEPDLPRASHPERRFVRLVESRARRAARNV